MMTRKKEKHASRVSRKNPQAGRGSYGNAPTPSTHQKEPSSLNLKTDPKISAENYKEASCDKHGNPMFGYTMICVCPAEPHDFLWEKGLVR